MDYHKRSYGSFHGRVHLQGSSPMDASLVITEITLEDYGKYKCEVIDGLEDGTVVVSLDLEGKINLFQMFSCLRLDCVLFDSTRLQSKFSIRGSDCLGESQERV